MSGREREEGRVEGWRGRGGEKENDSGWIVGRRIELRNVQYKLFYSVFTIIKKDLNEQLFGICIWHSAVFLFS